MKKRFNESSKTGAIAWLFQRISAVVLFVFLLAHYIGYHFLGRAQVDGHITYEKVKTIMSDPWFNLIQFLFLITALYHGINGIWMVVEDYVSHKGWRMFIYGVLWIVGLGLLFIGTMTIVKISSLK